MRRVEMIEPFDVLRGNVSGSQKLAYAENNNPAFDAPEGRQYARNYKARYICAKRSSDGLAYFMVKKKAATQINAASLLRMALLGGTGALYAAMLNNASIKAEAEIVYAMYVSGRGETRSFRKFWCDQIRPMLAKKNASFSVGIGGEGGLHTVTVDNPWVKTSGAPNCPVSDETLVKFWPQLATSPIVVEIKGAGKAIAHEGETFSNVISGNHNTLGLTEEESGEAAGSVKLGDEFVNYTTNGEDMTVAASQAVNTYPTYWLGEFISQG